ncbi:MAG TPA: cupredoxin domain-containing protein [Actinomycetota bacterium]|nr:cupredoxin domain-containing protein [Actinomycetota bacterium]
MGRERGRGRGAHLAVLTIAAVGALATPALAPAGAQEPISATPAVSIGISPEPGPPTTTPPVSATPAPPTPSATAPIEPGPGSTPVAATSAATTPSITPADDGTLVSGRRARVRATVEIADDVFRPMEITVTVGTEIRWTNLGQHPHTVTANDRAFDSGTLEPGQGFSITVDQVGRIPYYCQIHGEPGSGMFGVIVVQEASEEEEGDAESPVTEADVLARTGLPFAPLALVALALAVAGALLLGAGRRATRGRG